MQDNAGSLDTSLDGLDRAAWLEAFQSMVKDAGMFQQLGPRHFASFVEDKNTLLVTFETIDGIRTLSSTAHPLGFEVMKETGWSHLCIISDGDTWFRDQMVYGFFDRLIDDGFFEGFDKVVFYGAGPCGYAAAAYSVAAPGASVLAIQPQATLDPRVTEWDDRFTEMRRLPFNDRYGYAPDMLDAADHAVVIYDPRERLDAMHAALFRRKNVTRLRMPFMGGALQTSLLVMGLLPRLLVDLGEGTLTEHRFYRMARIRRGYRTYLRNLMNELDRTHRTGLNYMLCSNVTRRMQAPRFKRRLEKMEKARAENPSSDS